MEVESVKKWINKKAIIVLKNNFTYTTTIPDFVGESFSITDRFGEDIDIDCSYIAMIREAKGGNAKNT